MLDFILKLIEIIRENIPLVVIIAVIVIAIPFFIRYRSEETTVRTGKVEIEQTNRSLFVFFGVVLVLIVVVLTNQRVISNPNIPVLNTPTFIISTPVLNTSTPIVITVATPIASSISYLPTAVPTTAVPTTAVPTTAVPTTAIPTTAVPTTAVLTTAVLPTAVRPTAVRPTAVPPSATPEIGVGFFNVNVVDETLNSLKISVDYHYDGRGGETASIGAILFPAVDPPVDDVGLCSSTSFVRVGVGKGNIQLTITCPYREGLEYTSTTILLNMNGDGGVFVTNKEISYNKRWFH